MTLFLMPLWQARPRKHTFIEGGLIDLRVFKLLSPPPTLESQLLTPYRAHTAQTQWATASKHLKSWLILFEVRVYIPPLQFKTHTATAMLPLLADVCPEARACHLNPSSNNHMSTHRRGGDSCSTFTTKGSALCCCSPNQRLAHVWVFPIAPSSWSYRQLTHHLFPLRNNTLHGFSSLLGWVKPSSKGKKELS